MEKRDLIVIVVAIIIVLIMALYVKPLVTGKEVKIIPDELAGLFGGKQEESQNFFSDNTTTLINDTNLSGLETDVNKTENLTLPTITPTPVPTWDGSAIQIGFSEKDTPYYFLTPEVATTESRYSFSQKEDLDLFTQFSGSKSAITNTFFVPSHYWELQYTVSYSSELMIITPSFKMDDIPVFQFNRERFIEISEGVSTEKERNKGETIEIEDYSGEKFVESYSILNPSITILVIDAATNQTIRKITPDGGLDPLLWDKNAHKERMKTEFEVKGLTIDDDLIEERVNRIVDPRPWTEKFFSTGEFYLIINAENLDSYEISIYATNPVVTPTSSIPSEIIKNPLNETIQLFIKYYNSEPLESNYIWNLSQLFSTKVNNENGNSYFRTLINSRVLGYSAQNLLIYGTRFGNENNLKGELILKKGETEKSVPLDLNFVIQEGVWKIDTPIIIRV